MNSSLPFLLKKNLSENLPGISAHQQFSSHKTIFTNAPFTAIEAGVLILLYPYYNKWHTVFIKRNEYKGPHSGQISFPGGKREKNDEDIIQTALRESEEETRIPSGSVEILGKLTPLFIRVSNYNVFPVVGFLPFRPKFRPDRNEVEEIIEISFNHLLNPLNQGIYSFQINGINMEAPCFVFHHHKIWGATAMMLNELIVVMQQNKLHL